MQPWKPYNVFFKQSVVEALPKSLLTSLQISLLQYLGLQQSFCACHLIQEVALSAEATPTFTL